MYKETLILTNKIFQTIQEGKYDQAERNRIIEDMKTFEKIQSKLLKFMKDRPYLCDPKV